MKGFVQRAGVDYDETYAPVAKLASIRIILAVGVHMKMFFHQLDVKTALLHGELEEEIYMEIPEGIRAEPKTILKLEKNLNGLKQSPRCWSSIFFNLILLLYVLVLRDLLMIIVFMFGKEMAM